MDPYTLGFTGLGILKGSTAAGMMSAEALASGGGVVKGGTVALLQSAGALGYGGGKAGLTAGGIGCGGGPVLWTLLTLGIGLVSYRYQKSRL